jgi:DnaJ-class molecular chaperone
MTTLKEVILCQKCKGEGSIVCDRMVDYHRREYDTWRELCRSCGGSGRSRKTTVTSLEKFVAHECIATPTASS